MLSIDDIRSDWQGRYGNTKDGISLFDVRCERIVYALLNSKITGQPNSSPVRSDLFFEVENAYVHIGLKNVTTNEGQDLTYNIGDFNTSIFVGENQNLYKGEL